MARQLQSVKVFVCSTSELTPDRTVAVYNVVDGEARKKNCFHLVESPNYTKTGDVFWNDIITELKTKEEIT